MDFFRWDSPEDQYIRATIRLGRRLFIIQVFFVILMIFVGVLCFYLGAGAAQAGEFKVGPNYEKISTALINTWRYIKGL